MWGKKALSGFPPILESRSFQGFSRSTMTFFKDIFYQIVSIRSPQEEWFSHKIMERPYKISKKLASYQIQGLFKDFIEF